MAQATAPAVSEARVPNRWFILLASVVSMVAVANYQYGWTFFVPALQKQLKVEQALIQVTFTVFVLLETWLVPFEGWLVDKFGPRFLVMGGGVLAGIGWILSARANNLTSLYLSYALCGVGAGIVYGTAIGIALKWFPDYRGLAAGLTAAGFGAGSALTVYPITSMIDAGRFQGAFMRWGIIQGIVVLLAAWFIAAPPDNWLPKTWRSKGSQEVKQRQSPVDFTSGEMASTKHFWLMYFMMTLVATGGLMATAQLAPMATDFKVAKLPIHFLWWTMTLLTFAGQADRVINGLCRPFWGWISDRVGRERTMTLAFGLEALAIYLLISFANRPMLFVIFSAFTFFGWAEIYSLFPALSGDFFGRKHATENYGFLYTAKGTASVFVPIGSALAAGKAFDFRADILLLIGVLLIVFALFLAPTVLRINLGAGKAIIVGVAAAFVIYGIVLTVIPTVWTPFVAKFGVPNVGWKGVFKFAIVFDLIAALLAFLVLRRMKAPVKGGEPIARGIPAGVQAPGAA